jgi:membrane-bound inhibitor of C-type lysozyme
MMSTSTSTSTVAASGTLISTVNYACSSNNTITASYYNGPAVAQTDPNQPPTPTGYVTVQLSDGRTMTLDQTISADGTRYSNTDGSFVFWSKGNGAMVMENNQPSTTYTGCTQVAAQPQGSDLTQTYVDSTVGFSIRYPQTFTADNTYKYQEMGPGKDISGVKFTIPSSMATGTNLSNDSYISVESLPGVTDEECSAGMFLDPGVAGKTQTITDNGTTYSFASSTDAGAGNRYEESVYVLPSTNPCIAVRYYIHYGAIENYPAGSTTAFSESAIHNEFDAIRDTLTVNQ